jgi:hypothetical protein
MPLCIPVSSMMVSALVGDRTEPDVKPHHEKHGTGE